MQKTKPLHDWEIRSYTGWQNHYGVAILEANDDVLGCIKRRIVFPDAFNGVLLFSTLLRRYSDYNI